VVVVVVLVVDISSWLRFSAGFCSYLYCFVPAPRDAWFWLGRCRAHLKTLKKSTPWVKAHLESFTRSNEKVCNIEAVFSTHVVVLVFHYPFSFYLSFLSFGFSLVLPFSLRFLSPFPAHVCPLPSQSMAKFTYSKVLI
jgi:hypothetical protein